MPLEITETPQTIVDFPKLMINENDSVKRVILVSKGSRATIVQSVNAGAIGNDAQLANLEQYVDYDGPLTLENIIE